MPQNMLTYILHLIEDRNGFLSDSQPHIKERLKAYMLIRLHERDPSLSIHSLIQGFRMHLNPVILWSVFYSF